MNFIKPKIKYVKLINLSFYKIILSPINKNYSSYFSSFLRNIIYTNTQGYAITEVKFFGVNSEFDYIPGVQEDVFNLILNLKGIIFKINKKKKIILNLNIKGFCIVKASDFFLNEFVSIINPDHIIAHLSKNFYLNITVKIEKGLGYFILNNNNCNIKKKELEGILLDVNFSPVINIYYKINNFDSINNLDKIEFFIKTNGSINPKLVFIKCFKILNKLFNLNYKKKINKNLFLKLSDLNLPKKFLIYFKKINVIYIGDLIKFNEKKILKISNLNFYFLKKIKDILLSYKLYLGIKIKNWKKHLNNFLLNNETFEKKK